MRTASRPLIIMLNPPFGREWKNEKAVVEKEAKKGFAGRFGPGLPATSDGQMLFLMTAIAKMGSTEIGHLEISVTICNHYFLILLAKAIGIFRANTVDERNRILYNISDRMVSWRCAEW